MTRKLVSMLLLCAAVVFASCSKDNTTPNSVQVAFSVLTSNGGATETTTALTLTFNKAIDGLSADDITLTAAETEAVKGALTAKGNGVYELAVSGITKGGEITIAVAKAGYMIIPASKKVAVSYVKPIVEAAFSTLTANGSATELTTALTLTFDKAIEGLSADDITLTAAETEVVKGALTAKENGVYELSVSGITKGGEITVAVAKAGYSITPTSKRVTMSYVITATVGDFYMKDGTLLSGATTLTAAQQAACIGIVYWTGDPTTNDATLKAAHPTCTHGLVVALKDAGIAAWQTRYSDVDTWVITNSSYAPIASGRDVTDPMNKIMGYNNTKAIEAFNADAANSVNKVGWVDKVVAYRTAIPTPASNSGWFLPSEKELTLLCGLANQDANIYEDSYGSGNRDAINTQLAKIVGSTQIDTDYYWSSTQYRDDLAWSVHFFKGLTSSSYKYSNCGLRVVSAF